MKSKETVFGLRPVMENILAGKDIEKILIQKGLTGDLFIEFRNLVYERKIPVRLVPADFFRKYGSINHQGVMAFVSSVQYTRMEDFIPFVFERGEVPLVLLLDRITDVRNFGAIARTAECAGVNIIVIPEQGSAMVGADAMKTSAGALSRIPIGREKDLVSTAKYLKNSGFKVIGATEKASLNYTLADYTLPTALIMGSEEDGLSPALIRYCDELVRIPLHGNISSLNVSVACGVLLYEILRQRENP